MGEESTRLRDTPSHLELEAGGDFGFGFPGAKKESLTPHPLRYFKKFSTRFARHVLEMCKR